MTVGQRIAMRTPNNNVSYLLSDHLGSTSLTTNSTGTVTSEMRYTAWGETRFTSGTSPTNYRFTGQRQEASFGLYFYNARWYDPALSRFAQADTIVPGGVQGLDRYAYVNNNAVRYVDPSGHMRTEGDLPDFINAHIEPKEPEIVAPPTLEEIESFIEHCEETFYSTSNCRFQSSQIYLLDVRQEGVAQEVQNIVFYMEMLQWVAQGLDVHEAYTLASSKWYKAITWSLPTGPIEVIGAGIKQYYRDSWWRGYSPEQRFFRIGIAMLEASGISWASDMAGNAGTIAGGAITGGNPVGAGIGFLSASYVVSSAGDKMSKMFNRWFFPLIGLGIY